MRVANCVQASCAVVIYAALVFEPGPRRRLRRRRTVFAFGGTGAATFFVCAIFAATAFGGRPGPPGRHFPRALRRRRRPFVVFGLVPETPPSSDWIAEPTSCCTMSRITVTKLFCLGIVPPFGYGTLPRHPAPNRVGSDSANAGQVQRIGAGAGCDRARDSARSA